MLRLAVFVLASFVVLVAPTSARAQTIEHLTVVLTLEDDDTLLVEERFELGGELDKPFERTILRQDAPGPVPRRQWITDLRVTGVDVRSSTYDALDRTSVVVERPARDITLRYRVHRIVPASGHFEMTTLDTGKLQLDRLTVRFVPPDGVTEKDVSWGISVLGDDGGDGLFEEIDRAPLEHTLDVGASDVSIAYDIRVPADAVERPRLVAQLKEMVQQAGMLPYLVAALIALALLLRLLPIGFAITFTRLWHVVVLVPIVLLTAPDVIFFLRRGPLDEALVGLGIGLACLALIGGYGWLQDRGLRRARREAFFIELALPVVLTFAFPVWNNPAATPFLPLLGLPVAIYWLRDDIALAFGAASHRIVEHVVTEGRITLDALAAHFGLSRRRLERVLRQQPDLPLVTDYAKGMVYSEQAAAELAELSVCANCGGATEVAGMNLVACPYCHSEYANAASRATERPVPVIVEAFARIAEVLAAVFAFWGVAFGLAFAGLEGGFGAVVLVPLVLCGALALGAYSWATSLRAGTGYFVLVALLLLTGPFVVPLFAFRPLGRRRVKLHFGRADVTSLKAELDQRGEMTIAVLAQHFETSLAEATELGRFLCATKSIDAVYDRPRGRLVSRSHYAAIEHHGACRECGGTMGVVAGVVRCHYCRTAVAA